MTTEDKYQSIRMPKAIIALVDEYIKEHPEYNSRLSFICETLRIKAGKTKK